MKNGGAKGDGHCFTMPIEAVFFLRGSFPPSHEISRNGGAEGDRPCFTMPIEAVFLLRGSLPP